MNLERQQTKHTKNNFQRTYPSLAMLTTPRATHGLSTESPRGDTSFVVSLPKYHALKGQGPSHTERPQFAFQGKQADFSELR
jgi:hypothetical protein